jgi:hypothetical protein
MSQAPRETVTGAGDAETGHDADTGLTTTAQP